MDANAMTSVIEDALAAYPGLDEYGKSAIVPAYRQIMARELATRGEPTAFKFARFESCFQLSLACGDGYARRFDVFWKADGPDGALAGYGLVDEPWAGTTYGATTNGPL